MRAERKVSDGQQRWTESNRSGADAGADDTGRIRMCDAAGGVAMSIKNEKRIVGLPGGMNGPFYSVVTSTGRVVAMQIVEKEDAEFIAEIPSMKRHDDMLLNAVKLAYRKHHLDDPSIGWEELSDKLHTILCEVMSDKVFCEWLDAQKAGHE